MRRRQLLTALAAGAAATAVARPAVAQSMPEVKWRLTSSFPKSIDLLFGAAETFATYVAQLSDNKFQIQVFSAGELVPSLQALDAVSNGTADLCHTRADYYFQKDPAFALFSSFPLGPNARQQNAWFNDGGGSALMNDFLGKYKVRALPGGNTGTLMGGWFRKEVKDLPDLRGLRMRVGGLSGSVLQKLGVVPQQIAGGDIYPALEKGTIDAAEWIGPYDDEKLGFYKVAPYYYYPAWWRSAAALHFFINLDKWNDLPEAYQGILAMAAAYVNNEVLARNDARNPEALKRLVAGGANLRPFSPATVEAGLKAAGEVYAQYSGQNADFNKAYSSLNSFRNNGYLWWQVAEYTYDTIMIRNRTRT
jgi:TRAP-type mannitol/chloroaromatic compound transport system substrate-binding protein